MQQRRKNELFQLNHDAWKGLEDAVPPDNTLDASLKKNTSFIKRLRNGVNQSALPTFLEEIRTLSLHKYLSEIILASYDGLCKLKAPADVFASVEVLSALHQRFGSQDFTSYLGWYIATGLSQPDFSQLKTLNEDVREKEEKERITLQKSLLRSATELWITGVLTSFNDIKKPKNITKENNAGRSILDRIGSETTPTVQNAPDLQKPFPLIIFREIIINDREYANLPLISSFVKLYARDIFGGSASSIQESEIELNEKEPKVEKHAYAEEDTSTAYVEHAYYANPCVVKVRQLFVDLLQTYFEGLKSRILKDQNFLATQGGRNLDAYIKYGEVFGDRQAQFERQLRAQNKLYSSGQVLADVLKASMPDISDITIPTQKNADGIEIIKAQTYFDHTDNSQTPWEDEEEYRFYQQVLDLKPYLPASVIDEAFKRGTEKNAAVPDFIDQFELEGVSEQHDNEEDNATSEKADEASLKSGDLSIGAEMDALLSRLPSLASLESVDQLSIDFCRLNSKASRNRLIKAIRTIPKGRLDLVSLFARLVATLAKYMPDIAQGVVSWLADEFRSLQYRKHKKGLEIPRIANIRYIAELAKFRVIPEHTIFHCLKVGLDDFTHNNIEIICSIMDICGKFLYLNPETSPRMKFYLSTLEKKKTAQHLAPQDRIMIENAVFSICPPENVRFKEIKDRSPIEQFVRKLIYEDLTDKTIYKVVKQIRKLHWEEEDVRRLLHKIFTKPWNIEFGRVYLLAAALGLLRKYHSEFTIIVVDELLESLNQGLERNDYRYFQRRMSEIKYLGELYTYRMIESSIIFDTLFRVTTYSWEGGLPNPGVNNSLDPPDDCFRVQMICILLESCGIYFVKGNLKKRLDFFLSFFEYYYHTKERIPKEIEFMFHNLYASLRPRWQLATNIEEAGNKFAEMVKMTYKESDINQSLMLTNYEIDLSSNDTRLQSVRTPNDEPIDLEDKTEPYASDSDDYPLQNENLAHNEAKRSHIIESNQEDDESFDREFSMMVADSVHSRATERIPVFDMPLPMRNKTRSNQIGGEERPNSETANGSESMKFMLLSKKGSKATTRPVDLPLNVPFATALQSQQQANREEQQRIKNLVLKYSS